MKKILHLCRLPFLSFLLSIIYATTSASPSLTINPNDTQGVGITPSGNQPDRITVNPTDFQNPPLSVHVDLDTLHDITLITWYNPSDYTLMGYDDGTADSVFAWPVAGNKAAVRFTPESYPAHILSAEVNIYDGTWPPGNILTPFQVAVYDDDGPGGLPGTELALAEVTPFDYGWVYVDFSPDDVTIESGDFYVVWIQGGDIPDCAPIAVDLSGTEGRSFIKEVPGGGDWEQIPEGNIMIRSWIGYSGSQSINPQNRDISYYEIYRLKAGDELTPENWTLLDDGVIDTLYYDTGWPEVDTGHYRYAVIAHYPENESDPAFSNVIKNGIDFTINVRMCGGEEPAVGAEAEIKNQDNNPEHDYHGIAPQNGIIRFLNVYPGIYDLTVTMTGMQSFFLHNISVLQDITMPLIIPTACLPPSIYYDYPDKVCFYFPNDNYERVFFEDFEGGVIPPGWTQEYVDSTLNWVVTMGSPSGSPPNAYSGEYNATFYGSSASTLLITPPLNLGSYDLTRLQFWHTQAADSVQDELKLYYRTSAMGVWHPLVAYIDNVPEWKKESTNLPEPSAQYQIAFLGETHPGGLGICLDDIEILYAQYENEINPPCLEGFNVTLNGGAFFTTENCISDLIPGQFYIITVSAVYTDCVSQTIQFPFTNYPCDDFVPPRDLAGSLSGMELTLTWNPPPGPEPQEYQISYDDGVAENAMEWYNAGGETAVRFSPLGYPCEIRKFHMNIWDGTWPPGVTLSPFRIVIYDDDGPNGYPGTELGSKEVTPLNFGWTEHDISDLNVTIGSGDFYLAHYQLGTYPEAVPTAVDETSAGQGRSFDHPAGVGWGPGEYDQYMIRATVYGPLIDREEPDTVTSTPDVNISGSQSISFKAPASHIADNIMAGHVPRYFDKDGKERFTFMGFHVFRNGEKLTDLYLDTVYSETVSPGGTYQYSVTAVYDAGESCVGYPSVEIIAGEGLAVPLNLDAGLFDQNKVMLTWNAPSKGHSQNSELLGYHLWRNQFPVTSTIITGTTYTDVLYFSDTYVYTVSAVYDDGESFPSVPDSVTYVAQGHMQGDISDATTLLPVQEAEIQVSPGDYTVTSQADGSYHIDNIPPGFYNITVTATGYHAMTMTNIEIKSNQVKELNFQLFSDNVATIPFTEPWDEASFEYQHWSFAPAQGQWAIDNAAGNPAPSAEFQWEPGNAGYIFALVTPYIWYKDFEGYFNLDFDLKVTDNGASQYETMQVEYWHNFTWDHLATFRSDSVFEWTHYGYTLPVIGTDNLFRIRYAIAGEEGSYANSWHLDNIRVSSYYTTHLSGRVTDQSGNAIADATVTAAGYPPATTDPTGWYDLTVTKGYYTVTAESTNYKPVTYENVSISGPTTLDFQLELSIGIQPNMQQPDFLVFPNPSSSYLIVKTPDQARSIVLLNCQGQAVHQIGCEGMASLQINVEGYTRGLYFVQCILENGQTVTKKIIVMR